MIKKARISFILLLTLFLPLNVQAQESEIYKQVINQPMQKVYPLIYEALEDAHFYVVFEPYISKTISRFAEKWGNDYNRNKLDGFRSMVICNGWYANQVSNVDPDMLSLCPLRVGLYEKAGKTTIVFARPTVIARHSKALPILQEVENTVIDAIKAGAKKLH